ncbi:hypothetical protein ABVT39_006178 [Epinephelus coioides]
MTVRKTDKEEERERAIRVSRSDAVTHLRPHLVTFLSPHAITLSPHVRATLSPIPLATEPVSPVLMRPGSPLTFCFFHTRYREKSQGTGGRAVVSGHAYHPRSQAADINATGAIDL